MSKLNRQISVASGTATAISMVIGSGLLGLPGVVIDEVGPRAALAGWLSIVAFMLPMLLVFARLGLSFPKVGGLSHYAEVAFGPWARSAVVTVLVGTFSLGIPALAFIGAAYAARLFGLDAAYAGGIAAFFLALSIGLNLAGVRVAGFVNVLSIFFVLAVVAVIVMLNPQFFARGLQAAGPESWQALSPQALWNAYSLIFWAFLGWENLSFGLEEFRNPKRTIPIVYLASFVIVLLIYWTLAVTASGAALSGVAVSGAAGLASLFPPGLQLAMAGAIAIIILANANSWVFGCSRLVYSAGEAGILPRFLGRLDGRGIPRNSLLLMAFVFAGVVGSMALFAVPVSVFVKLVSQNFIVLFAVSIVAYVRTCGRSAAAIAIAVLASGSCLFLISGFSLWLAYPLGLVTLGVLRFRRIGPLATAPA